MRLGRGSIAPTHSRPGDRMRWVVSVTPKPRISPVEKTPCTHCTGGWVGPRAGLDTEGTGKILSPLPGIEPGFPGLPARCQTLYWLSYPAYHLNSVRVRKVISPLWWWQRERSSLYWCLQTTERVIECDIVVPTRPVLIILIDIRINGVRIIEIYCINELMLYTYFLLILYIRCFRKTVSSRRK
jgi:hypothetical protein